MCEYSKMQLERLRYLALLLCALVLVGCSRDSGDLDSSTPQADQGEIESLLTGMEIELWASLDAYGPPSNYRRLCALHGHHDRAIGFFRGIVDKHPTDSRAKIELALAYVDKIQTRQAQVAVIGRATLAQRSLDQLEDVKALEGGSWVIHYCLAMNHLYWPRALKHSDDSIAEIKECIALQEKSGDPAGQPYYERSYLILGDALTKGEEYEKARAAWRRGLQHFPDSRLLRERLEDRSDTELLEFIEARRSLRQAVDTDLSFLETDPR